MKARDIILLIGIVLSASSCSVQKSAVSVIDCPASELTSRFEQQKIEAADLHRGDSKTKVRRTLGKPDRCSSIEMDKSVIRLSQWVYEDRAQYAYFLGGKFLYLKYMWEK